MREKGAVKQHGHREMRTRDSLYLIRNPCRNVVKKITIIDIKMSSFRGHEITCDYRSKRDDLPIDTADIESLCIK